MTRQKAGLWAGRLCAAHSKRRLLTNGVAITEASGKTCQPANSTAWPPAEAQFHGVSRPFAVMDLLRRN